MKSLKPLFFSRPRKYTLILCLAITSSASALTPATPAPANNQVGQPSISGMIEEATPAAAAPPSQALPSMPINVQVPEADQDSQYAKDMEAIQQEIAMLEQQERKAKLEESLLNYKKAGKAEDNSEHNETAKDTIDTEIRIRSIYGVGRSYQAVIYYRGAELTVKQGSDINGIWKVGSISPSTVRIRNGKTERVLSLSATTQGIQPQQNQFQPQQMFPPIIPPGITPSSMPIK